MLWCNAGTVRDYTWTWCTRIPVLCAHSPLRAHTHAPMRACLSNLTAGTVSCVIGTWRGWMDGRRGTTLDITRPGTPSKQTHSDWWLPSFGIALSKPSAHPSNHRQWTAKWQQLPLNAVLFEQTGQRLMQFSLVCIFFFFFTCRLVYSMLHLTLHSNPLEIKLTGCSNKQDTD